MNRQLRSATDESSPSVDRRTFMRKCAVSLGTTLPLAGCNILGGSDSVETSQPSPGTKQNTNEESTTGTPENTREQPPAWEDFSVTHVDANPGDDISGIVQDIQPNELLVFPSGRYSWSNQTTLTDDGWGIWCQPDTIFEVSPGIGDGSEAELIATDHDNNVADGFLLKNLTFDSEQRAAPGVSLGVRRNATVDGLEYLMNGPISSGPQENGIRAFVESSDGSLTISNYQQFNNGNLGTYGDGDGRIGIWVGPQHEGTVHLQNPVLQGFPNNACYVSHHSGSVIVEGGLLMNNNVSAVRVSGGVEVRDTTIYIDIDRYRDGEGVINGNAHNTRGLWGDNPEAGTPGGTAEGLSFVINSYDRCTGLATMLESPRMTLRGCQFLLNTDIVGIQADVGEISLQNCHFAGDGDEAIAGEGSISGSNNNVAREINPGDVPVTSRSNSTFEWTQTHLLTPERWNKRSRIVG